MVRPVEDLPEDDAPAAKSHAGGSVGQLAAELGAKTLRDLGLAELSPKAVGQLARVFDQLGQAKPHEVGPAPAPAPPPSDPLQSNQLIDRVLALVLALGLLVLLALGALGGLRIADRLTLADQAQSERLTALEVRAAEAEAKRLEHQAKLDQAHTEAEAEAEARAADLELVKARQSALVLYLLDAQVELAKAQGVELPDPPAVLRIAQAEATLGLK